MGFFDSVKGFFSDVGNGVKDAFNKVKDAASEAAEKAHIKDAFSKAFDAIKNKVAPAVSGTVSTVYNDAKSVVSTVYNDAKGAVTGVANEAGNVIDKGLDIGSGLADKLGNTVQDLGGGLSSLLSSPISLIAIAVVVGIIAMKA